MMETKSSVVHVQAAKLPATPLSVTLVLAPDPTRDYTDVLRDIVELAFGAGAGVGVEIKIVDPADEHIGSDEDVSAVRAALLPTRPKQLRSVGTSSLPAQRRVPRGRTRFATA